MGTTKQNLDIQSDKVLTEPTVQTRIIGRDLGAAQSLFFDWDEPAGADRTVNFEDPGADDTVVYKDAAQVLQNKQITTPPVAANDIPNKTYVDTEISTAVAAAVPPTATSGAGGGIEGTSTYDSMKGLDVAGNVAEVKVDGVTITFNGSGQLVGSSAIVDATAGSGGATKGKITADSDKGLDIVSGVMEVKVDGVSVGINLSGELETLGGGGGGGGPTGTVSAQPQFTEDITAITAPGNGTTGGGDISTLDFLPSVVNGTRFAIGVPEDYFSGNLLIEVVQQMSAADVAGAVEVTTQAKIVDVSAGIIDSGSYPESQSTHTVPTNTDVEERTLLTILDGDFAKGDNIQVLVKRLGNDVGDVNAADWKVLSFRFSYTAIINGRIATVSSKFFEDYPGETPTTSATISAGDITVEEFPTSIDTGLKFEFSVPAHWDEISDCDLRINYTMSASDAGDVRLESTAKIARIVGGTIDTLGPTNGDFTPGAGDSTVPKQSPSFFSIPASSISKGDTITILVARRGTAGADTHTGDLQLICAMATFGTVSSLGVNAVTIREEYLNQGAFGSPVGAGVNGDTDHVDLTDFETFDRMEATIGAGSLDVSYMGRLGALTTSIKQISFFVKGTGTATYAMEVHVEGTVGDVLTVPLGPVAPPIGSTEVVRTDLDLSAQPTGSGRFVVIIKTVFSGAAEEVLVSRPFVRLE
jgi:hypothetical protein